MNLTQSSAANAPVPDAAARSSAPGRSSPSAVTRARASTLHVDLGPSLKSAVAAAAERAGVGVSDWVRSRLQQASQAEATQTRSASSALAGWSTALAESRRDSGRDAQPEPGRVYQVGLASDDIDLLDRLVAAGGFRSRPAALRFLLRAFSSRGSVEALAQLPDTQPVLAASNIAMQDLVRQIAGLAAGEALSERRQRLAAEVRVHLEHVSRVLAALQPLMAPRG